MSTNSINTNGMSMTEIINRTEDLADQNKKTTNIGGDNLIVTTQHDGQLSADDVKQALAVFAKKDNLSDSEKQLQQTLQFMDAHQEIFNAPSGASWGNAQVLTENIKKIDPNFKDSGTTSTGESLITTSGGFKNLTQVSHEGQWEAITGGADKPMTLDDAKKALTDPKISSDTKASAQWLVNNWSSVAGDGKSLTLDQAQKLGTTPEKGNGAITTGDAYKNLTTISHDGQWEAITGGDKDTPLTLDAAQKALSDPNSKLSDDTKKSLQWTVDNWAAVAGDKTKSLTLDQTQKYGTTPKEGAGSITSPEAYKNLTGISHDGQWEAITGGKDKPLTLDVAQKALSDPNSKLSADTKKSLQWTVDNWAAVAGDNSKSLTLDQAQKLGTTPKEGSEGSIKTPDAYKNLTQISHDGQWEAITGGKDKPLTLDVAQKALSDPNSKLSADTKKSLQWTVDNWAAVAGDNSKSLTLDQTQKLGTTPPSGKTDGPGAPVVGTAEQNTQARIDARSLVKGPDDKNKRFIKPEFDPTKTYTKDDLKKMADQIEKGRGSWKDDPFLAAINKLTAENSGEAVVFNSIGTDKGWDMNKVKDFGNSPVPDKAIIGEVPKDESGGKKSDGFINNDTQQQSEGDCVFLSTTRGISQTEQGRTDIKNAIKANDDGSYDVKFKGSDKSYHVSKEDAERQGQWANGDIDMQILGSAADQYFKENGHKDGLNGLGFGDVTKLLTGKDNSTASGVAGPNLGSSSNGSSKVTDKENSTPSQSGGNSTISLTGNNSADEIRQKLLDAAPNLGKTVSIGLSGGVGDNATWKAKDTSHEFQIESIDTKTETVTYTNPWNTSEKKTIKIKDLADQLVADPNGSTIDIFNVA